MKDLFDTFARSVTSLFILFGLLALAGSVTGCASAPPDEPGRPVVAPVAPPAPIAAVVVTTCGKSVALYVITDDEHMILFAGSDSTMFEAVAPGVMPKITHAESVPFETAYALAQRAPLTSHVVLPCQDDIV